MAIRSSDNFSAFRNEINRLTDIVAERIFDRIECYADESVALTAGTAKATFRMVGDRTLVDVRGALSTAQATGGAITVDIHKNGTTVLSTKITINNTEKTSVTAAAQPVISDSVFLDDDEITVDIDSLGDGTAKGLKVVLIWA